jgi:drug/metabolite transporter (DMT)-like permease
VSTRAWATFAAVSVLWGLPYLFIKIAVDDGLSPVFIAWSRLVLAAVVLVVLAAQAGALAPLRGRGRWLAAFAVVELALPFPLIGEGERHVSSSLAAILIAAAPLFVALLAIRFDRSERATGLRLVGLVVGLLGVVALMGIDVGGRRDELLGAGAILLAALGYATGPLILKHRLGGLDQRALMGVACAIAAVLLTPAAAFAPPDEMPTTRAIVAIVVLGLLCSALALVLMGRLIREVGPGRALVVTYINPLVAVILGIAVLGESLGAGSVLGLVLILGGSWLATGGRLPPGLRGGRSARVRTARAE